MINFGLFGVGRIGSMHAKNIFENKKSKLVYVYDLNKKLTKKIANKFDCKIANNPQEIFNDDNIQAILIASPTNTHIDLIINSVRKGKAVLCEKPIDLNINKIEKCEKIIKKYKVPIQIGFNRRFDQSHLKAIKKCQNGEIGNLEKVIITSRDPAPPSFKYLSLSGGIFRDMTIHDFDLSRLILGKDEIVEVFSHASNLFDKNAKKAKDYDTAMILMKSQSGVLININNSRRSVYGYDQRVELFGSKGMIISDNVRSTNLTQYSSKYTNSKEPIYNFFIERYYEAYKNQLNSFIDIILNNKSPLVSFNDGKKALILANAAYKSLKDKKIVKL